MARRHGADLHIEAHHADEAFLTDRHLIEAGLDRNQVGAVQTRLGGAAEAVLFIDHGDGGIGNDSAGGIENAPVDIRRALGPQRSARKEKREE